MNEAGAAILAYHAVDDSGAATAVSPARFAAQIEALLRGGYRVVALDALLRSLASSEALPPRAVSITFDDGYESVRRVALPVLARHGLSATVFVTTGHCGGRNDWPTQPASVPTSAMLDAEDLRALWASGVTVGAHGVTHAPLTQIPLTDAVHEIAESRRWLEELLGVTIDHFAYPYGDFDARVRAEVAKRFRSACGTELGFVTPGQDPYALHRIDAHYLDGLLRLGGLQSKAGRSYLRLRASLRRWRGARSWSAPRSNLAGAIP